MDPLNIGDTSGGRGGFFYFHPFGGSNRFEVRKILKSAWGQPSTASETATGSTPPPPSPAIASSYWEIAFFGGYGASELFGPDPLNGKGTFGGYNLNNNLERINSDGSISSGSLRRASKMRAICQLVWNVTENFSVSAEGHWQYDDQGAIAAETVNATTGISAGISSTGSTVRETGGSNWVLGGLIRPIYWLTDWFALQGQAGIDYVNNNRNGGQAFNPNGTLRNDAFGHSGALGVFTFAPTIKPLHRNISTYDIEKGGFYTRPEFRIFVTYAIWAKALEGSIGNNSPNGTPYGNNREGWVFGVQTECSFSLPSLV
jgi:hypothetical protein